MSSKQPDTSRAAQIQADASREAANLQAQTTREGIALQERMFQEQQRYLKEQDEYNKGLTQQNQTNYQPYIDAGKNGLNMLTGAINDPNSWLNEKFDASKMDQDSGYNFRREQGQNALNQSLAARGGLLSGAALKATDKFSQGLASDEYNAAYQRFTNDRNNRYTQLNNLTGLGIAGASGFATGSPGSTTGTQLANIAGANGQATNALAQNGASNIGDLMLANAQQQAQYSMQGKGPSGGARFLGGAASGAATGSAMGPWGALAGGIIGGLSSLL